MLEPYINTHGEGVTLHPYKGIIKLQCSDWPAVNSWLCDWSALHRDWTGGTQLHIIFPLSTICMNSKKYAAQVSPIGQYSAPTLVAIYYWHDALFRCQTKKMSDFKRNHLWGKSYSLSRISRRESLCSGLKLAVEYWHGFRPLFFYLVIR